MRVTCPCCDNEFPIEAGFIEGDGKRFAALVAELELALGRAVLSYLRLFKPAKTALRLARAARIVDDLVSLVRSGTVCKDERVGVRRPANQALWAAGIEQMLSSRDALSLPLDNHNYLRAVVFGLADKIDAKAEQARETVARSRSAVGPSPERRGESPTEAHLHWLRQLFEHGRMSDAECQKAVAEAKSKVGQDV
ncbi:hypothetical protein [Tahibacter soli]|uniref:Uncharacterized protein n=1 Tax=Tahibacter soli TaxID=2983605 RepID=A0A9X3YNU7_9GAMM|nr:hypothetical protein [Tahibacter soli]MDC8015184.1 hypothetical protein [Tahibacter soli]